MGNKILGRRSKSFYKGFNDRQLDYLKEKFQTMSKKGILDKKLFMKAYKITEIVCDRYFSEVDFDENSEIDEYEFICSVHSLCSMTIEELGHIFYKILTRGKSELNSKSLEHFTKTCLSYNAYLNKKKIDDEQISKSNKNKFKKYDYDKNGVFDLEQFVKICQKDQDYKMWMYNMGFLTKRQLDFQEQIYDLVDSDIGDEIDRHSKYKDPNQSKIKEGIEHRIEDDEFQIEEEVGEQSAAPKKPWVSSIKNCKIGIENPQSPSQTLEIEHVFGYRSFDCRNNVKYDTKGRIVYHQAAIGIVMEPNNLSQSFIVKHHDDISCLDISEDTVVTGQVGSKPMLMVWQTNKEEGVLKQSLVISEGLKDSIGNVCISKTKQLIAASCNDENHTIVIYDRTKLIQKQNNLTSTETGVIAVGSSTKNIIFDIKFTIDEKCLAIATLRELLFLSFDNGTLNENRGVFGNFSVTPTLCLLSLKCKYKGDDKEYILSGMGNGSVYFWDNQKCCKAVSGHRGSVSALAQRKDCKSFVSGDKTGKIIIWNDKFTKQYTLDAPKTNCPSNMIVSLSCNAYKEIMVGTKSSDIYTLKIGQKFDKAETIMSGHNDGHLWALAMHKSQPYLYTGGEDQRLIKWDYVSKKKIMQRKCPYKIRSLDFNFSKSFVLVGYQNGVIECYKADNLQKTEHSFREIKNPDEETLNLIKFDKTGGLCAACYQLPEFKIVFIAIGQKNMKQIATIETNSKVISLDFEKQTNMIRFNTGKFQYFVYDIKDPMNPKKLKADQVKDVSWATHSLSFSPQTQGIMTEGVVEEDIICCERSRRNRNVFVIGDKFSKIKLFNYPSNENKIFNKYIGHSNQITGLQFNREEKHLISVGGQEKSIIVWKYDANLVQNQWFIKQLEPQSDLEEKQFSEDRLKKTKMFDEFAAEEEQGEQALSIKPFLAEIKNPSDFKEKYNARKDNKQPEQSVSIKHVFGVRNKYIKDEVRNQCKFSKNYKQILFPTACLGVKMDIQSREQQFYHEHKEDIVSFAIDPKREVMATGQMAQKNPYQPRKKILSIYVWDINGKKVLNKLDGFHTIAVVLLEFSPNSKLLFSCGNDDKNTFAVYDWMSGSILYSGPVSRAKVNGISWKSDNEFMTCGNDHVKIWTGGKGQLGKIKGKSQGMFCCVSSKRTYVSGSGDGGIYNWSGNISGDKIKAHTGKVQALVFFKDSVYSGGDDGKVLVWRTAANGQVSAPQKYFETRIAFQDMLKTIAIREQEFGVLGIDFSPQKDLLVVTKGASVIHYNNKDARVIHQGHYRGELWALSTRIDDGRDNLIITGGDDRTVRLWDIEKRKQVNRTYFEHKIRGLDWASRQDKVVIADARSRLYLFNSQLTKEYDKYTGRPYDFNKKQKIDPWVEEIKFSPDNKMIAYGCHGKSMYMETVSLNGDKLQKFKSFTHGSSALLHLDWDVDSSAISLNTQAYEYMFYDSSGGRMNSSATADYRWATWTKKFGFPVQGIFQGVDYSDINTVCRDPTERFLAVGYDDQSIRLFNYPCYIPKQVNKQFFGHSSHVTRIKFTSKYMVSLGGLDRTVIVWDIEGLQQKTSKGYADEQQSDDGLDDIDEDVDLPSKAVTRKLKPKKIQQFYEVQDQGDQFMAVKPWLGAIKQPTYEYPKQQRNKPNSSIKLEYVQGYRCKDSRQNLFYVDKETIVFHAAAVVIYHNIRGNKQHILDPHNDDILSIDFHQQSNQVITGQLGPKPLVCLFKNGQLDKTFQTPVKKGVLAIAISPDGEKAACAGMDEDHHVSVLDLQKGKVIATMKGTKKVITKIVWVSDHEFVSVGINHYKYWTLDGKKLTGKQSRKRGNFVSVAYDQEKKKVFTGGSKGSILPWRSSSYQKQVILSFNKKDASVVESLKIYNNYLVAGTKDGLIFVLDKNTLKNINMFEMQTAFFDSNVRSECPSIRSLDILYNKLVVGTLGAQIYELEFKDIETDKSFKSCKNILKCHYSPNNSWTNQVWGLHLHHDMIFTCSDDATLRCWSILDRKLLSCVSTNVGPDNIPLDKDKRTRDFSDSAKGRAVCLSPDGKQIIVGSKNGTVRVYTFNKASYTMKFKSIFRHSKQWISDIKFAYNTLIIGSHDNAIYVYDYEDGQIKRKYRPMKKHSSYITHMDVSRDSCFLQSTCGAYQILFWDLNTGKQITSGASMLRDQRWSSWTCNLGWPVQGIYPKCTDGTFINSVDRSHTSVNRTLAKDDSRSPYLLAAGNDNGKVTIYNYPCTLKSSDFVQGRGHSSHVTNVRWSQDDNYLISVGGEDQCVMYWKVQKS